MRAFIDTNIFVYATYSQFQEFAKARQFLKACMEGHDAWYLGWSIIYEYLRVVTHPQLFPERTLSLSLAVENVTKFIDSHNVVILQETQEHFTLLKEFIKKQKGFVGNILHDAHTVLLMQEHDVSKIFTADMDFARFKDIEVANPFRS